ncbi:MAG TPA: hypothetical protein VK513_18720, partial [Terriglobales bacterium]|nr:hypothetical protein [Terriglobales bacterium]
MFLLLLILESIKNRFFYLLQNQSSAGRPQPGAAAFVQSTKKTDTVPHPVRVFRRHFSGKWSIATIGVIPSTV